MARADTTTWLPLDDFAKILGLDPIGFNGLSSSNFRPNTVCGAVFFQEDWMHSDRVGRETIAQAIQQAEYDISKEAGFNLMPDWVLDERLAYPRPSVAELYGVGLNPRLQLKSIEANKGYLISGGIRAKSLIQSGAAVTRTDVDGDTFAETCTVVVPVSTTDLNEIRAFYPAQNGDDRWEIRPIEVSISGGNATLTFKVWQIVAANQLERLNPSPIDAETPGNFETTIDVYRVYNDTSTQLQFLWEGDLDCCGSCVACQLGTQEGCFHLRDHRLGILVPAPATFTSNGTSGGDWTAELWSACREPDQVRIWYYSGYRDNHLSRPYAELSPYWKRAIAFYAASMFDRDICGCSNVAEFISKWRRDAAFASETEGSFTMTSEMASNKLGTSMGALYAYRAIQKNGVRINK